MLHRKDFIRAYAEYLEDPDLEKGKIGIVKLAEMGNLSALQVYFNRGIDIVGTKIVENMYNIYFQGEKNWTADECFALYAMAEYYERRTLGHNNLATVMNKLAPFSRSDARRVKILRQRLSYRFLMLAIDRYIKEGERGLPFLREIFINHVIPNRHQEAFITKYDRALMSYADIYPHEDMERNVLLLHVLANNTANSGYEALVFKRKLEDIKQEVLYSESFKKYKCKYELEKQDLVNPQLSLFENIINQTEDSLRKGENKYAFTLRKAREWCEQTNLQYNSSWVHLIGVMESDIANNTNQRSFPIASEVPIPLDLLPVETENICE